METRNIRYKKRHPEFVDALAEAGISTAQQLAEASKHSIGTAQKIMRGEEVSLQTAIGVVHTLQKSGANAAVSTIFKAVNS